jgi:riboflavin kinase/FMN adenylyltransferase
MQLIRGIHNLRPCHHGCVVTVGNFDGVHLGHREVLDEIRSRASGYGVPALVMAFEPTPQEFFAGAAAPARLTRFREKYNAIAALGIDRFLCVRFDARQARMQPEVFIEELLVKALGVRYLVVGDDFRFGYERRGDFAMLAAAGRTHGFELARMPTFELDGERVSSSRIRRLLVAGMIAEANFLLGRPYRMSGRVVPGQRLGRDLGFPTANIDPGRAVLPLTGVFAVRVAGIAGDALDAVASLGTRPTVDGSRPWLEVHVFDFAGDLYGQHVHVDFFAKLRDEYRFENVAALTEQMHRDARHARILLAQDRVASPGGSESLES